MSSEPLAAFLYVRGLVAEDTPQYQIIQRSRQVQECINKLVGDLNDLSDDSTEEEIQGVVYEAGKIYFLQELRFWFQVLYQILMKQNDGPRIGQLAKIMTLDWLIHKLETVPNNPWGYD